MASISDPRLPPELEREIFEIAAAQCQRKGMRYNIARFALVAVRVSHWVQPFLYSVWTYTPVHDNKRFNYPPLLSPPDQETPIKKPTCNHTHPDHTFVKPPYAQHVKHILFQWNPCKICDNLAAIIQQCPNVQNLSLWISWSNPLRQTLYTAIASLPITKLTVCHLDTAGIESHKFDYSLLSKLTHFYAGHVSPHNVDNLLPMAASSPALTHLCIGSSDETTIRTVLDAFPHLRILAVSVSSFARDKLPATLLACNDPRLVLVWVPGHYVPLFEDWEAGAFYGEDMWGYADQVKDAGILPAAQLDNLYAKRPSINRHLST